MRKNVAHAPEPTRRTEAVTVARPPMKNPLLCPLLVAAACFLVPDAQAATSSVFSNSPEAVEPHEAGSLEILRTRCTTREGDSLLTRPEVQAVQDGYVAVQERLHRPGRYSVFVFDVDKQAFFLIDGQRLDAYGPLALPLALPRDYARCRFVQGGDGSERLEVVHTERKVVSSSQAMQRLIEQAEAISAGGRSPGANPRVDGACTAPAGSGLDVDIVLVKGKALPMACSGVARSLRQRMSLLIQEVYGR